jgi:hypothetical protein
MLLSLLLSLLPLLLPSLLPSPPPTLSLPVDFCCRRCRSRHNRRCRCCRHRFFCCRFELIVV